MAIVLTTRSASLSLYPSTPPSRLHSSWCSWTNSCTAHSDNHIINSNHPTIHYPTCMPGNTMTTFSTPHTTIVMDPMVLGFMVGCHPQSPWSTCILVGGTQWAATGWGWICQWPWIMCRRLGSMGTSANAGSSWGCSRYSAWFWVMVQILSCMYILLKTIPGDFSWFMSLHKPFFTISLPVDLLEYLAGIQVGSG